MSWRIPLSRGRHLTLLSVYAPTLDSDDAVKDSFYDILDSTIHRTPHDDKLIILGDFNARVGKDQHLWEGILGRHGIGNMNSNGLRLLSLCSEHNMVVTNTLYQMKNKYKTSWMHPRSKHWHLLDYVLVRQRDQNEVLHTRAMRGAECSTDHNLIRTKLRLKIRPQTPRMPSAKKIDCNALKNIETRESYRSSIAENISHHSPIEPGNNIADIDNEWSNLKALIHHSAEETLGFSTHHHKDWFDENAEDIHDLIKKKNKAHNAYLSIPSS